ncbi:lipid-A-disaccharide synthase [uncultured Mailhella sp.]|uniref:lipid-A-disaccharide synthase n=1 Tax=uncultured Mailhella sp. TaxID=1981031 RepID=UPI0025CCF631|nr:lipid-A-disaccharide synthase [uncultured Mailhella sp.]
MKTLWINAGEISGDLQGGALLSALRDITPEGDLRVVGMGGDNLARAGQENLLRVEELSVMGIVEVITSLPRIFGLLRRIRREMARVRPDAVLLIDAPEFNFRVAKIAHALGIPVYYFIPPKVWAWRTGRVKFLKRHVRRIFSILPFEVDFYRAHGMDVTYVGNPLVDLVDYEGIRDVAPVPHRIGLMPGSRRKEVDSLMPAFAGAADLLVKTFPDLEFHCVRASNFSEEYLRSLWNVDAPLVMHDGSDRYRLMRTFQCIMAASGTATLETGLAGVPTLVAYKVSPLSYQIALRVIKVKWISLTNLIMNRTVFPEHIEKEADPAPMARRVEDWLTHPQKLEEIIRDLDELRERCGSRGSALRAAEALAGELFPPLAEREDACRC